MKPIAKAVLLTYCLFLSFTSFAITKLPSFFTDNMVLQQNAHVPFWGTSAKKTTLKITTSWDDYVYTAESDKDGKWKVDFKTPGFGGPYTITINDGSKLVLSNILIGDVWLCSGQSNMEMPLAGWGRILNYQQEIVNANYPEIRLLQAEHVYSNTPVDEFKVQNGGWQVCSPETISEFSSTAYFFARKIYNEKHIPIGLLHSSWGGTIIEAWTSAGALKKIHDFDEAMADMAKDQSEIEEKYRKEMGKWNAALVGADKGLQDGKPVYADSDFNDASWQIMKLPAFWENGDLGNFDGVVWYRREFDLDKNLADKDMTLTFYADDDDEVWINNIKIGATKGYNLKRQYKVDAGILNPDNNVIVIRVFDSGGGGGIYGDESELSLSSGNLVITLAGEWKYNVGVPLADLPAMPAMPQGPNRPTVLYNAMIHPIENYKIKGVIWYQGESNEKRAHQYQTLFPLMIKDWREKFNNKNMPFLFVQLANYRQAKNEPGPSEWAEVREAQFLTLQTPNTGMAVTTDIGDAEDIHPKNKQEVGERLARIALAKVYGEKKDYSGPLYKSYTVKDDKVIITFDFDDMLQAKDGKVLKGFTIAGAAKKFYNAEAKIDGNNIIVSSPKVTKPMSVRYNWADNPDGNLTNASGLPASSFRTDTWNGITYGKK